jgi:TonB family protein
MPKKKLASAAIAAWLGGCAIAPPPPPPLSAPQTLNDYKLGVAKRIAAASAGADSAPLPGVMKSIVVLEITVDELGAPLAVSVYRTNGYPQLAQRALQSVAKAAPFAAPAPELMQGARSVSFLETFLFRDDDSFQLRSLVGDAWKSSTTSPPASTD